MGVEYDITNELGPCNWLDAIAGEAIILGHDHHEPLLVIQGTRLAGMLREIKFDDGRFGTVEALGKDLEKALEVIKKKVRTTMFIDDLYVGGEKARRSSIDWEYDLMCENGIYQINMYLPVYYGTAMLSEPAKVMAERGVRSLFEDPSFLSYRIEELETKYESQVIKYIKYFDKKGRLVRMTVDFNHEGSPARGWNERYYFVDFAEAMRGWEEVKRAFISGRKR